MKKKIAIIGGGIAGISCAAALIREGYEPDIFEQASEIKEIGAILGVLPNGMAVLHHFGLTQYILQKGGEMHKFCLKEPNGNELRSNFFSYKYPAVIVRRSDLLYALLSTIKQENIYTAHRLVGFKELHSGKLLLQFENGKTADYDVLIGADGIHSVIRKQLVGDGEPIYRGYNLWRGVCKLDHILDHSSETWGQSKRFGLYPLQENWVGWWASIEESKDCTDDPIGSKQKLLNHFSDWHDPISALIQNTEKILKNSISDRKPYKKWYEKNVVMIGDAAHCTTPNLGQGANMAMESALLLSRCIGRYGAEVKAFQKYQELQFKRTKDINKQSLMIGRVGQMNSSIGIFFRNIIFKNLPICLLKKIYDSYYAYDVNKLNID